MKKIIAFMLAALMIVFCVACGNTNDDVKDTEVTTEATTEAVVEEPAKAADEVLNAALDKFYTALEPAFEMKADEIKGAFVGGYFSDVETTLTSSVAGKTPVDVEAAKATFMSVSLITEDAFAKLDDAAVLHHMMNMNTFACSSMRVANAADVESVAASMRESIGGNTMWMCGFPEKYVVITVETCVISAYGNTAIIDAIKTAVTETYENAVVVCDEVIA